MSGMCYGKVTELAWGKRECSGVGGGGYRSKRLQAAMATRGDGGVGRIAGHLRTGLARRCARRWTDALSTQEASCMASRERVAKKGTDGQDR